MPSQTITILATLRVEAAELHKTEETVNMAESTLKKVKHAMIDDGEESAWQELCRRLDEVRTKLIEQRFKSKF